jgi:hypothetical protein
MAEKHNVNQILDLARSLIQQIQNLIDNKNEHPMTTAGVEKNM